MKTSLALALLAGLAASTAVAQSEPKIQGYYVETRTCDVFTGPCFANSETGLTGHEALMVWNVAQGSWHDTDLTGLTVVAAVRAGATLGDSYQNPHPAKSVLLVDNAATEKQHDALVDMAKTMGGLLLNDVVAVESVAMDASIGACDKTGACASVTAGDVATIKTRCLNDGDHVCGNETAFYPPLTAVDGAIAAYTSEGRFSGEGLNTTWNEQGRRGAFIATFAR
jgi:hypothetical protein